MARQPELTYTVEDFMRLCATNKVIFNNFAYKDLMSNGTQVAVLDTIDDYMPEIRDESVLVKLTPELYRKYRYKPKLLCFDIYGNTEVYFVILLLNGIIDMKEFDMDVVRMLPVNSMNSLLSNIYNAESEWMDRYNNQHGTL